jgi:hypothetical protein
MRFAARKFAAFLWVGAAIVAASIWLNVSLVLAPPNALSAGENLQGLLTAAVWPTITNVGFLIGLGAIVWLLGDIRDRLDPPQ